MAINNTFVVGDIVELISGGPKMTISRVYNVIDESTHEYQATWFNVGVVQVSDFYVGTLKPVAGGLF